MRHGQFRWGRSFKNCRDAAAADGGRGCLEGGESEEGFAIVPRTQRLLGLHGAPMHTEYVVGNTLRPGSRMNEHNCDTSAVSSLERLRELIVGPPCRYAQDYSIVAITLYFCSNLVHITLSKSETCYATLNKSRKARYPGGGIPS